MTLAWLAELLGLPAGLHGHLEDTRLDRARHRARGRARRCPGRRVVVCSEHTHSSTAKAARLLELELRTAPTDDAYALRPDVADLTDACALVATVGTTSSAAIDPVAELADRCAESGVWLHVDAAYAGSAAVCPELRPLFAGWERADSVGVNPHKWLFTPMDCSAFFTRRPDALRGAFSLVPEYLRVDEDVVSLSEYSVPLGRRFRALKLWAVLRCYGRDGLQAVIREHLRLAALFEAWVEREPGWEVCAPRHFSLVCFRRDGSDEENESAPRARQRHGRGLPLAHAARRPLRAAARDRQRPHDGGRRAPCLGRPAARGVRRTARATRSERRASQTPSGARRRRRPPPRAARPAPRPSRRRPGRRARARRARRRRRGRSCRRPRRALASTPARATSARTAVPLWPRPAAAPRAPFAPSAARGPPPRRPRRPGSGTRARRPRRPRGGSGTRRSSGFCSAGQSTPRAKAATRSAQRRRLRRELEPVLADDRDALDADQRLDLRRRAAADAGDERVARREPRELVPRLVRHPRVLGPLHDRREHAVDVEQDRGPARSSRRAGEQVVGHAATRIRAVRPRRGAPAARLALSVSSPGSSRPSSAWAAGSSSCRCSSRCVAFPAHAAAATSLGAILADRDRRRRRSTRLRGEVRPGVRGARRDPRRRRRARRDARSSSASRIAR